METFNEKNKNNKKLQYSLLKYFWEANPIIQRKKDTIPKFLRKLEIFNDFSEIELFTFSQYLHRRNYTEKENIFKKGSLGIGFYLVQLGVVEVELENENIVLENGDYFGERALLQDDNVRGVSTYSCSPRTILLALFRPDLEEMIEKHPLVAAKLLQSLSKIIILRLGAITAEVDKLKIQLQKGSHESRD